MCQSICQVILDMHVFILFLSVVEPYIGADDFWPDPSVMGGGGW